jgi:hypothetical protein
MEKTMKGAALSTTLAMVAIALAGCVAPSVAPEPAPNITLPDIEGINIRLDSSGNCAATYKMTNHYSFTYEMNADLFMIDAEGNTLGTSWAMFPPALPGKSSQAVFNFYSRELAGNTCKPAKKLIFKGKSCKNVSSGNYLMDSLCKGIDKTFPINN